VFVVQESPVTRASLLVRLRDSSNHEAWREFLQLYSPLVYGFVRNRGLQDADAADLLQEVLRSVSSSIGRLDYDKQQGGFRAWLFTITRNRLSTYLSGRRFGPTAGVDPKVQQLLDAEPDRSSSLEEEWEREFQRQLTSKAMQAIEPEFEDRTWQAFWLSAVDGVPAADISKTLGMSTGAIYVAKSRVLARLKTEIQRLQTEQEFSS
jgi:RNA polymerase sigma-70 factor (ECF subfamily)